MWNCQNQVSLKSFQTDLEILTWNDPKTWNCRPNQDSAIKSYQTHHKILTFCYFKALDVLIGVILAHLGPWHSAHCHAPFIPHVQLLRACHEKGSFNNMTTSFGVACMLPASEPCIPTSVKSVCLSFVTLASFPSISVYREIENSYPTTHNNEKSPCPWPRWKPCASYLSWFIRCFYTLHVPTSPIANYTLADCHSSHLCSWL